MTLHWLPGGLLRSRSRRRHLPRDHSRNDLDLRNVLPLRTLSTLAIQINEFLRTLVQLLSLIVHDQTREVNRLERIRNLGVPSPILPVKKDAAADRPDERFSQGRVSGTHRSCGLEF